MLPLPFSIHSIENIGVISHCLQKCLGSALVGCIFNVRMTIKNTRKSDSLDLKYKETGVSNMHCSRSSFYENVFFSP